MCAGIERPSSSSIDRQNLEKSDPGDGIQSCCTWATTVKISNVQLMVSPSPGMSRRRDVGRRQLYCVTRCVTVSRKTQNVLIIFGSIFTPSFICFCLSHLILYLYYICYTYTMQWPDTMTETDIGRARGETFRAWIGGMRFVLANCQ
jgi:hypothetical protein